MLQKIMNDITVSSRMLILFFIICTLLVAKSLFLIMFITVFATIVVILSGKNVKFYVSRLKKTCFWLLFFSVIYIMIFRDVLGLLIFIYKINIISILLIGFMSGITFGSLTDGIYTIVCLGGFINKSVSNLDKKAYNFAKYIYSYKILINSSDKIKKLQQMKNKKIFNVKNYLMPKLFYVTNKISKLEDELKLNFYNVKIEKNNLKSVIFIFCSISLFITAVLKEVVL